MIQRIGVGLGPCVVWKIFFRMCGWVINNGKRDQKKQNESRDWATTVTGVAAIRADRNLRMSDKKVRDWLSMGK